MRHQISGRQLGRTKDERRALFRGLIGELIIRGRIKTTVAKAKAIRPLVDKLVTKAKKTTGAARREVIGTLPYKAADILLTSIAPQLKNRTSGFLRTIRLEERLGDNAEMVVLEWTDSISTGVIKKSEKPQVTKKAEEKTAGAKTSGKIVKKQRKAVVKKK